MPIDASRARHENFMALFDKFSMEHSHLPQKWMLKLFADRLGLSAAFLSHIKCDRKAMGSATARQIESALDLPHGWMDHQHTELEPNDVGERDFIEQALILFRSSPAEARRLMLDALRDRLDPGKKNNVGVIQSDRSRIRSAADPHPAD